MASPANRKRDVAVRPHCRPLRTEDKKILASSTTLLGYLVIAPSPEVLEAKLASIEKIMCSWQLGCSRDAWLWEEDFQIQAMAAICSSSPAWCQDVPNEALGQATWDAMTKEMGVLTPRCGLGLVSVSWGIGGLPEPRRFGWSAFTVSVFDGCRGQ